MSRDQLSHIEEGRRCVTYKCITSTFGSFLPYLIIFLSFITPSLSRSNGPQLNNLKKKHHLSHAITIMVSIVIISIKKLFICPLEPFNNYSAWRSLPRGAHFNNFKKTTIPHMLSLSWSSLVFYFNKQRKK